MNLATIEQIIPELREALIGRRFGKVFVLSRNSLAIDFRLTDSRYLFVSVEPADPRTYLIRRRLRDLEKASTNPTAFAMQLKKRLSAADLTAIDQIQDERALRFEFRGTNELGDEFRGFLIAQLTGKSANLFLLDSVGRIIDSLRNTLGEGQQIGDVYTPPAGRSNASARTSTDLGDFDTLSEALDAADLEKRAEADFRSAANSARTKITREISKLEKLRGKLLGDLDSHGDAERWKRYGDLLLANVATAKRNGSKVEVIDYFDETAPMIEIDIDENDSLTAAAEKFFKRYTKARNARDEIAKRLETTNASIESANAEWRAIETAIETRDVDVLTAHLGPAQTPAEKRRKENGSPVASVARIFTSSDGFEILVGKRAKDNDQLTFKIAKSLDTWMHAADYPGSHVVIRNRDRKDIPPSTLLEAAQLAAFYSQGKAQPKAAVHYTLKKFVNKPKGAAPGLVSLASFKTLLVKPDFPESVAKKE